MSEHLTPNDQELVERVAQQDQAALTALYQRYGTLVYSLAYRVLNNAHLAEEVTQDTFMKVWRGSTRWDSERGRFSSWLLTIARYTAIDRLRQEQRHTTANATSLDDAPPVSTDIGRPDDPLLQDGQLLRQLMQQLPEEQSQVIKMAFFMGLTHRELAEKLNLPLGTVKTRVRLGLQKLRKLWHDATKSKESQ
jgi:RNA polymerase sigma-70 factor, ECF subfamily